VGSRENGPGCLLLCYWRIYVEHESCSLRCGDARYIQDVLLEHKAGGFLLQLFIFVIFFSTSHGLTPIGSRCHFHFHLRLNSYSYSYSHFHFHFTLSPSPPPSRPHIFPSPSSSSSSSPSRRNRRGLVHTYS